MTGDSGFVGRVGAALDTAASVYAGTPGEAGVAEIRARLHGPLRVAIAGKVKAGKSTLLNALVGEELAPTDAGECTQVPWWFHDGLTYRATLHPRAGPARPARFVRVDGALVLDLDDLAAADLARIDVEWPSRALRTMTLIDTPGIASATRALSAAALRFFAGDGADGDGADGDGDGAGGEGDGGGRAGPADAVLYLMRHLHAADIAFLESFQDDGYADATPVNTIAVLSRADEIGVGRLDAMESAVRVADRYRGDGRLRRLCQTVVPVAGLLAQAAATLREDEFRLLRQLVDLPPAELEELLLSVDRFSVRPGPAPPAERLALLRRFGIFGTRTAVQLLREGQGATAPALATALLAVSRLDDLRELLRVQFAGRRDLLKGRAALLALGALVRRFPVAGSAGVAADVERIQSSAHELVEIRLLNALRTGEVTLRAEQEAEAVRLLGADGTDPRARLGLSPAAPDADVTAAFADVLARWQRLAENPIATGEAVDAARVLIRTCEALAASIPTAPAPAQPGDLPQTGISRRS
ncbi:MAG TPA: dynamin family protein [Acidimicrobiales bacterium]|jgi:hypothetical protein|nr:dynamin family protein [Acidimicrobiales bacterium]